MRRRLCLIIWMTVVHALCFGQGCSDAGFCTVGSLRHSPADSTSRSKVHLLLPVGSGDRGVIIFTPGVQYDLDFADQWTLQGRVTANRASGELGTAFGPGDIYLGVLRKLSLQQWLLSWTLAGKIPLESPNLTAGGRPLPMVYQSSLGTFDVIAGASATRHRWMFALGWQQPLSGPNNNRYEPQYSDGNYPQSYDLHRKGDVLLRIAYSQKVTPSLLLQAGLLNIYYLGEDTYRIPGSSTRIALEGSQGLTLNLTAGAFVKTGRNLRLGLTAGAPVVVRDVRPDGLTRNFVISPELQWTIP